MAYTAAFSLAVLLVRPQLIIVLAGIFNVLTVLPYYYDSSYEPTMARRGGPSESILFQSEAADRLTSYLKAHSGAKIPKVVNLCPGFTGFVPKNYTWILRSKLEIFDYYGYSQHVSTPRDYHSPMTYVLGEHEISHYRPWWEWIQKTGGAFALFEKGNPNNDPQLSKYVDIENAFTLKDAYVIAPLFNHQSAPESLFDNGVIRILGEPNASASIDAFNWNRATDISFKIDADSPATMQYLFWPNRRLKLQIDNSPAAWTIRDGLQTAQLPKGKHEIRIHYSNPLLSVFLALLAISMLFVIAAAAFLASRSLARRFSRE